MLFNSLEFPLFLGLVLILFSVAKTAKQRQGILLATSLFFYGYWKWTYLLLLIFSSSIDYWAAIQVENSTQRKTRKLFLLASISANLTILFYFKYSGFLAASFFPDNENWTRYLNVLLPVGISFYTFQAMGYVIDVYRGRLSAERNYFSFLTFITFFPQLVAGPIERAPHLLRQLNSLSKIPAFQKLIPAFWLIGFGFAKKILVADRIGVYVDAVFNHPQTSTSPQFLMALVFFGFQIYTDFSGYSDIARGVAKLFGVELMHNFNQPYLAKTLTDFWRRWHISLSGWFRDYIYFPLGGGLKGNLFTTFNLLIVFALSGIWHGANWTFLLWGLWHGIGMVVERFLLPKNFNFRPLILVWIFIGWFFFRVNSLSDLYQFQHLLSEKSSWNLSDFNLFHSLSEFALAILGIGVLLTIEWNWKLIQSWICTFKPGLQIQLIGLVFILILWFGHFKGQDFIYFQF